MAYAKSLVATLFLLLCEPAFAEEKSTVFFSDFEGDMQLWALGQGAKINTTTAHSGTHSLQIDTAVSMSTKNPIAESGIMELWVRSATSTTHYKIKVMVNSLLNDDAGWQQVGMIEGDNKDSEYHAKRISIDDSGSSYIRLDIETINGTIDIDDITINRILLSAALQKNQQIVLAEVLARLRDDKSYQLQAEALQTLGKNYTSQIEEQRQYIEYGNAIFSSISLLLATSERSKLANPLAYPTFKHVIEDVKKVASPIQKRRFESLLRPFGDIAIGSLNILRVSAFNAFVEPFKSMVASSFEKSSYENADLSRKAEKFAEKNGLKIYQTADKFLLEVEKDLARSNALEKDLTAIKIEVDRFRKDLSKHLKGYLVYGGQDKLAENYNRIMSKDNQIREAALRDIDNGFARRADQVKTRSKSNAQLVQFIMQANGKMDELQEFNERFNLITSALITFYDKYNKSIAPEKNPFSHPEDRKAWELGAIKMREYIQLSQEEFKKTYL